MRRRSNRFAFFAFILATYVCACDPGLSLYPVGWGLPRDYRWSKDVEGVHLRIGWLGGLIGSTSVSPELDVENPTDVPFVVDGGTLETNGHTYEMRLPGKGEEQWRSAPPHSKKRITLSWHFDRPLFQAIGKEATATRHYRIGPRENLLVVHFRQQ